MGHISFESVGPWVVAKLLREPWNSEEGFLSQGQSLATVSRKNSWGWGPLAAMRCGRVGWPLLRHQRNFWSSRGMAHLPTKAVPLRQLSVVLAWTFLQMATATVVRSSTTLGAVMGTSDMNSVCVDHRDDSSGTWVW